MKRLCIRTVAAAAWCSVSAGAITAVVGNPLFAQAGYPRVLHVVYGRAPVYDSANYMSGILGHLRAGDSVPALGTKGKFFRIQFGEREGYVLVANLSASAPRPKRARGKEKEGSRAEAPRDTVRAPVIPPVAGKDAGVAVDSVPAPIRRTPTPTRRNATKRKAVDTTADNVAVQQCRALTKAGKQCSRAASDSSGYCWQHRKK